MSHGFRSSLAWIFRGQFHQWRSPFDGRGVARRSGQRRPASRTSCSARSNLSHRTPGDDAAGAGGRGIALTGYGMNEDRAGSLATGFSWHLTKPVDLTRLREFSVRPPLRGPVPPDLRPTNLGQWGNHLFCPEIPKWCARPCIEFARSQPRGMAPFQESQIVSAGVRVGAAGIGFYAICLS